MDTPIHKPDAIPMAKNVLTAMILDTALSCARSLRTPEIPGINILSHLTEPCPRGPVATDAEADKPAKAYSPTVVQTAAPPLTAPTPADHCTTTAEELQPPTGIWSVTFQLSSPSPATEKANSSQTSDRHTSFHITLQFITSQSSSTLPIKVDPGTDVNMIPSANTTDHSPSISPKLVVSSRMFYNQLHTLGHPTTTPQRFIGFFIINLQQNTQTTILTIHFYIFHDTTYPQNLLSYAASERLRIDIYSYTSKVANWHGLECVQGKNVDSDMARGHGR